MPKTPAGTPKIKVSNGRLQIVLTHRGVRKYLSLGLPDSKRNRTYADMVKSWIENDLLSNIFDSTLDKYRRDATKKVVDAPAIPELTIEKLWDLYATFKKPQVAPSTFGRDYARISRYIPQFPVTSLDDAVAVRDWLNCETSADVARRVLTQISACCKWGVKSRLIADNPFAGLASDIKLPKREDTDIDPFSADERDRIVEYLQEHHQSEATIVEFLFRTGCRPSEACGLQWRDISPDFKTINFHQSLTDSEDGLVIKPGLKTQERRLFPCGEKLQSFLRSIAPNPIDRNSFIFAGNAGFFKFHSFSNHVWKKTLKALDIDYRNPYQMRHTYITFCINSGVNAKDVARLVGNSAEIIYKHYMGGTRDLIAPDF